jgi:5-methyltetrahydrofolate--homocysteine methyltransferase
VDDLDALTAAIEAGNRTSAVELAQQAIDQGLAPQTILDAMTAAMQGVGARFQRNEIYVPEMLIAARAMKEAMALLEPVLVGAGIRPETTAVIGTIKGDLHDIGKNLVGMMWKGAHIEVIDLGTNVPPERFVAAAKEHRADIVGISALLTTTMVGMRDVVAALRAAGLDRTRVLVGGAPVTAEFAREIGADGYAPDAGAAVDVAQALLRGERAPGPVL